MSQRTQNVLLLLLSLPAFGRAQTRVDGNKQMRNAPGTQLPASCAPGAIFFKTDASAGQNWYACTAINTWTVQGSRPWTTGTNFPTNCAAGDTFFKSDAAAGQNWYGCTANDTWTLQGNKPAWITGTSLPANCAVGDMFFKSDAAAGQNWYGCVAPNAWTLQGDGTSTGTGATQGPKLPNVSASESTATVGSDCATATCAAGFGHTTISFSSAVTFTITNQIADANVAFFIDPAGNIKARYLGTSIPGVALSAGLLSDTSGSGYPATSGTIHLLGICAASGGRFTSCSDDRASRLQAISSSSGTCSVTPTPIGFDLNCNAAAVSAYTTVLGPDGTSQPPEEEIQFVGSGVSVSADTGKTVVTITGGTGNGTIDHAAHDYEYDEFNGTNMTYKLGWVIEQSGAGGGAAHRAGVYNHPGIFQIQTAATVGSYVQLQLGAAGIMQAPFGAVQPVKLRSIIAADNADAATAIRFGNIEWTMGVPSNGYYLEKSFSGNTWQCVATLDGISTKQDTGVQVSPGEWYALEVERTAGAVKCKVATLLSSLAVAPECTVTTNLPTATHMLRPMFQIGTNAAAQKSIGIDFYEHDATVAR